LAISLCLGFAASPAAAQKADIVHFYTSTSESLAIGVFAKEYDKRGGTWVDDPAVGPQAEQALALNLPPLILRNVVMNGHFLAAPVDIHGVNWMFYSVKVLKDANLEPPKTWDEFRQDAPKLKAPASFPWHSAPMRSR